MTLRPTTRFRLLAAALTAALAAPPALWGDPPGAAPDSSSADSSAVDDSTRASAPESLRVQRPDSSQAGRVAVLAGSGELIPAAPSPFAAGERLRFSVQYGFINAGTAWLEVSELRQYQGHPVYHLEARAESNGFIDKIYKVRNHIESYMDRDGRFSWRYYENRREGGYRKQQEVLFDQRHGEALYPDGARLPIPPQAQDALSSFYFTRYLPLPIGGSVFFDYHASRKSSPLEVKVLRREQVDTPAGKFNCVVVEPILKAGGVFKNKGRLWIWLTDDERRIPVQMKSKVAIGSVSVMLTELRTGA